MSEEKQLEPVDQGTVSLTYPGENDDLPEIPQIIPVEAIKILVDNEVEVTLGGDVDNLYFSGIKGEINEDIQPDLVDAIFGKETRELAEEKNISLANIIHDAITYWLTWNRLNLNLLFIKEGNNVKPNQN